MARDVGYAQMDEGLQPAGGWIKHASRQVRLGFIRKVYTILAAQLALTVIIAAPMQTLPEIWFVKHSYLLAPAMMLTLTISCMLSCYSCIPGCRTPFVTVPYNYILLFAFTVGEAILVGFISRAYTAGSLVLCAGMTAVIVAALSVYAWKADTDFTGMGPYLFVATICFFLASLVVCIMSMMYGPSSAPVANMFLGVCGILLFSMYIVFDTQLMLGEFHGHKMQFGVDEYVMACFQLYIDIIQLFLYVLETFGKRR